MTETERRDVMARARAAGMTVNGIRVRVTGARHEFATVTIADRSHPFHGWSAEYSWPTIARAIETGGQLSGC